MAEIERLTLDEAEALARAALEASDTSAANAAIVARALIRAEADGQGGHGLSRVPSYAAQARTGKVRGNAVPTLEELSPVAIRVDAGHGFAFPAFDVALPAVAARARDFGIAAGTVHRSHHFGVAGHHCEDLARQGLVAFVYGNSPKAIALWGTGRSVLGTNPIAFAAPMPGDPLVIDMAVSRVARGKVLAAREVDGTIPDSWALDQDGNPTTDPKAALAGTMAPMGDAKGVALALMVEVMSACLAGAALGLEATSLFDGEGPPPDLGQSIIALDPDRLSGGGFAERIAALAGIYDDTPGARLPGTRRLGARAAATGEGLVVKSALLAQIREIAGR